jgi:hypothetical protein
VAESRHPDRLTAIASGLVAFLALAVSTYNVVLQRQQIRAQVWPYLGSSYSYNGERFSIQVENEGVGPAIVKTVELYVDKQPVPTWEAAFDKLDIADKDHGQSTIHGAVIPAGSKIELLIVYGGERMAQLSAAFNKRLMLYVCYCSVLDECFGFDGPQKRCPKSAVPFTQ